MKKLPKDTFPDHIAQTFEYLKGQPFQYACLMGTPSNSFYQAFLVDPQNIGQARIWIDKFREMANEMEEQIEHQLAKQKKKE